MRKAIFVTLTLCFLIVSVSEVSAFWWDRQEETEQAPEVKEAEMPASQQRKPKQESKELSEEDIARQRELKKEKREQLNNTEWQIELSLFDGGKKDTDVIIFKDNQVVFTNLSRGGFTSTNYTLTIQKDEAIVWETMQTSKKGEIAFWRGEVDSNMNKMRGILSRKIDDKTSRDYYFWSTNKKVAPPASNGQE